MNLGQKQRVFAHLVARLIDHVYEIGYEMTLGEVWRPPEMAKINAQRGIGISKSLHTERLAIDINLVKDGRYLTRTEDYAQLGSYWESLSTKEYKCCWGGRFGDGCHFSIEHNGVR